MENLQELIANPLGLAALIATAFLGARAIVRVDSSIEDRRRNAIKAHAFFAKYGMHVTASLLEAYSVGDYSGLVTKVRELTEIVGDEKRLMLEFDRIFTEVLNAKFKDPESRMGVLKKIEDLKKQHDATQPVPAAPVAA